MKWSLLGRSFVLGVGLFAAAGAAAQTVINEGSNRNFGDVFDEDGDAPDWVELYNAGAVAVDLAGWKLTDSPLGMPVDGAWTFGPYALQPGEHLLVFCSGKNRQYQPLFQQVASISDYTPTVGWNEHTFAVPFVWDGVSDLVINTCSFSAAGYITNSVFEQTNTPYTSTTVAFVDGSEAACGAFTGETHGMRPRIQLNGIPVGNFTASNGSTWYPAPYGNWYSCARNQMLYKAAELIAAGVQPGPLTSMAWNVLSTDPVTYTYIDIAFKQVPAGLEGLTSAFLPVSGVPFHTDFSLDAEGELVRLLDPSGATASALTVAVPTTGAARGSLPDGSGGALLLAPPTPGSSNGGAEAFAGVSPAPVWTLPTGVYPTVTSTALQVPAGCTARFTTDGQEPDGGAPAYTGETLPVYASGVYRARTTCPGFLPSPIATASYLLNVDHATPVVSVAVDPDHLYGDVGIFSNWWQDWERFADVHFFTEQEGHPLLFSRPAAIQIDGGAGGSRSHPQHSFRLELATGALGGTPVESELLPQRPDRDRYSKLYFRNGSNQWLVLPYKDAASVELMTGATNGYGSSMRPASVYINGDYFGLYEMREKFDEEYFAEHDGATPGTQDILTVSYWYGGTLRANVGEVEDYWASWAAFTDLDPGAADFVEQADALYDLAYLSDYLIGQTWICNYDWPYNNIKAYRSDATGDRWRFATIDLELALAPNAWSDCNSDGIAHALAQGEGAPFTGVWQRALGNLGYRHDFINRYADVMNTAYRADRLLDVSQAQFDQWVLEMPREFARWGDPNNVGGWMDGFLANHAAYQTDLLCKSESVWSHVRNNFNLSPTFNLTLATDPPGAGSIRVNTIVPEPLPWDGRYFRNHAISLEVLPAPGFQFMFWEPNGVVTDLTSPTWTGEINGASATFTAVFATSDVASPATPTPAATGALALHPNPVSATAGLPLAVAAPGKRISHYRFYDILGNAVRESRIVPSAEHLRIDVAGLPAGLYLLETEFLDGDRAVGRVVVE